MSERGTADVLIVGAGAAGLMAARFAALEGGRVVVLEHSKDGGRKILISGGGRCNVLPGTFRPKGYVTASSPNTLKKILRSWPLREQRRYFEEELGIPLKHEPEFDKLFPVSDRARDVRDALVRSARDAGAEFHFSTTVTDLGRNDPSSPSPAGLPGHGPVDPVPDAADPAPGAAASSPGTTDPSPGAADPSPANAHPSWWVETAEGDRWHARRLVLATGGLSVPATGSDGRGLRLLERLGHTRNTTWPALTPLLADPPVHADLAGVTVDVELTAGTGKGRERYAGSFLFTHRGYSGPVVLNASHHVTRHGGEASEPDPSAREPIFAAWTPDSAEVWEERLSPSGSETVGGVVGRSGLPERLARRLVEDAGVPWSRALSQLRREERLALIETLTRHPLPVTGDEGYRKAEVTGGGIDLGEVDPATLESRVAPGLHLCGELLDCFGPIGGHNFLWAWATGRAAGRSAGSAAGNRAGSGTASGAASGVERSEAGESGDREG